MPDDLWAVTSYFNPCGFRSRYQNYQVFRKHLKPPLLTVELAYGDDFELADGDATKLIQLRSDQVMWQKERLINLALAALPPECKKVAWLDCDIIFERDDWARSTSQVLEDSVLAQLFSRVESLTPEVDYSRSLADQGYLKRESFALGYANGNLRQNEGLVVSPETVPFGRGYIYSNGYAWAMRREVMEAVGLYDAMILGHGDQALVHAFLGRSEEFAQERSFTRNLTRHYLYWADGFRQIVDGRIGLVPGDVYTLWHGDLQDRNYSTRQFILQRFQFDPSQDIALDEHGCWRWNSDKPALHNAVRAYFQARNEDGPRPG